MCFLSYRVWERAVWLTIEMALGSLDRMTAPFVGYQVPDAAATGAGEQSQLSAIALAPQKLQHLLWLFTRQPFLFRHDLLPSVVYQTDGVARLLAGSRR